MSTRRDVIAESTARLRFAELTSATGALVLGIGLGALLPASVSALAIPVLALGAVMHAWGMYDKHRIEQAADAPEPLWHRLTYWLCWLLLAAGALAVLARVTGLV